MGARHISYKSICTNCSFPSLESRIMPPSDDDTNKHLKQLYLQQTESYRVGTRQQKTESPVLKDLMGRMGHTILELWTETCETFSDHKLQENLGKILCSNDCLFWLGRCCGLCVKYCIISLISNILKIMKIQTASCKSQTLDVAHKHVVWMSGIKCGLNAHGPTFSGWTMTSNILASIPP